jgi:hypothetical protein
MIIAKIMFLKLKLFVEVMDTLLHYQKWGIYMFLGLTLKVSWDWVIEKQELLLKCSKG